MSLLICVLLTALGLLTAVAAARRRRPALATRLLALALVPVGAYLTGLLTLGTRVADAAVDWATGLVLAPVTWVGVALLGVALVLFVAAGLAAGRGAGRQREQTDRPGRGRGARRDPASVETSAAQPGVPPGRTQVEGRGHGTPAPADDDFAEIEEILRRRGI